MHVVKEHKSIGATASGRIEVLQGKSVSESIRIVDKISNNNNDPARVNTLDKNNNSEDREIISCNSNLRKLLDK